MMGVVSGSALACARIATGSKPSSRHNANNRTGMRIVPFIPYFIPRR